MNRISDTMVNINEKPIGVNYNDIDENVSGRMRISYNGKEYETLWIPKGDSDTIFVVLNGARPIGSGAQFKRWSWYTFFPGHLLNIDDPMYQDYPELTLGWYYGTDYNYCEDIVDIVYKFKEVYGVKNIVFYASSGGGTAAIQSGAIMGNCKVVAINPQLFINCYTYTTMFQEITGIDLWAPDPDLRNDLGRKMQNAISTEFVICENIMSDADMSQVRHLYRKIDISKTVKRGLDRLLDNVVVWNYEAPGAIQGDEMGHCSQEWESMFYPIYRLTDIFSSDRDFEDWRNEYTNYGRFWYEHWCYESKMQQMVDVLTNPVSSYRLYENASELSVGSTGRIRGM